MPNKNGWKKLKPWQKGLAIGAITPIVASLIILPLFLISDYYKNVKPYADDSDLKPKPLVLLMQTIGWIITTTIGIFFYTIIPCAFLGLLAGYTFGKMNE